MSKLTDSLKLLSDSREEIRNALVNQNVSLSSKPKLSAVANYISNSKGSPLILSITTTASYNGKTVTATKGSRKITGVVRNNKLNMTIPEAGSWTITNNLNSKSQVVQFVGEQSLTLTKPTCSITVSSISYTGDDPGNTQLTLSLRENSSSGTVVQSIKFTKDTLSTHTFKDVELGIYYITIEGSVVSGSRTYTYSGRSNRIDATSFTDYPVSLTVTGSSTNTNPYPTLGFTYTIHSTNLVPGDNISIYFNGTRVIAVTYSNNMEGSWTHTENLRNSVLEFDKEYEITGGSTTPGVTVTGSKTFRTLDGSTNVFGVVSVDLYASRTSSDNGFEEPSIEIMGQDDHIETAEVIDVEVVE